MRDNKFDILVVLGSLWLAIFIAMVFGVRISPRIEQVVTLVCIIWFAYWTISFFRSGNKR